MGSLHRYVAKITQGNALFIRETIDQLLHYGHISIVMDSRTGLPESMKCTTDFESINLLIGAIRPWLAGPSVCSSLWIPCRLQLLRWQRFFVGCSQWLTSLRAAV